MGEVIPFRAGPSREPNAVTKAALFDEAVAEYETGFTDAELKELQDALMLTKRDEVVKQMRKAHAMVKCQEHCIAVNTLLQELLATYRTIK